MKKRILSVITVLCLLLTCAGTALAEEPIPHREGFVSQGAIYSDGDLVFSAEMFNDFRDVINEAKREYFEKGVQDGFEINRDILNTDSASYAQGLIDGAVNCEVITYNQPSYKIASIWGASEGWSNTYQATYTIPASGWYKFNANHSGQTTANQGSCQSLYVTRVIVSPIGTLSNNVSYWLEAGDVVKIQLRCENGRSSGDAGSGRDYSPSYCDLYLTYTVEGYI